MKKILSLLALVLLSCLGAWAQTSYQVSNTPISQASELETGIYALSVNTNSLSGFLFYYDSSAEEPFRVKSETLSAFSTANIVNNNKYLWKVTRANDGTFSVQNVANDEYLSNKGASNLGRGNMKKVGVNDAEICTSFTLGDSRTENNITRWLIYKTQDGIVNGSAYPYVHTNASNPNSLSYWEGGSIESFTSGSACKVAFYPVTEVEAVSVTYRYVNGSDVWYTETSPINAIAGEQCPNPAMLPYGVNVTSMPTVPAGGGTVDVPVTYTKGTRGFDFSADYDHAKWHKWYKRYSWQNTVRSELFYVEEANYIDQNKDNTNNTSDEYLWAAVGNPFDFVIINRAAGSGKYLSNPNATLSDANEPYMQEQSAKTQHYYLYNCTNAGNTWGDMNFTIINASTRTTLSGNGHLNYWVHNNAWGDDGSRMIWEWVMNEAEEISVTFNYTSNTGATWSVQKNFEEDHSLVESDYAVDFYNNYQISGGENNIYTVTCDDNFPFTAGVATRIQSRGGGHQNQDFYNGVTYPQYGSTGFDANANLWVFEHVANSADLFTVKNVATGKYLTFQSGNRQIGTLVETASNSGDNTSRMRVRKSTYASAPEGAFCLQHPTVVACCYGPHINDTGYGDPVNNGLGGWAASDEATALVNDQNCLIALAPTSYSANLAATDGTDYYGSIYLPYTMTLPAGVEAYAAAQEGDVLKLSKVGEAGQVVPEGAYILYGGTSATSATLALGADATVPAGSNALTGKFEANVALPTGSNYVLNDKNSVVGFYKYTKTTYPVAKAVFCAGESSSNAFTFRFDDVVTAIDALHSNSSNAEIFDLQGRRLTKAQQGMNIINGHKVLVK